jgi:hypothetical protein
MRNTCKQNILFVNAFAIKVKNKKSNKDQYKNMPNKRGYTGL